MRRGRWYEALIEIGAGKRVVLHEEGLGGEEMCHANALVVARGIRIARREPRPMAPGELH